MTTSDKLLLQRLSSDYHFMPPDQISTRLRFLIQYGIYFDGIDFTTRYDTNYHPTRLVSQSVLYWSDSEWTNIEKETTQLANQNSKNNTK